MPAEAPPADQDDTTLPCHEKLAFATPDEARAAAALAAFRYGAELKVYQCRHCGRWHLSSH